MRSMNTVGQRRNGDVNWMTQMKTEPQIIFGGIVQLTLTDEAKQLVKDAYCQVPPQARPLDHEDLHVTLWKPSKDERKLLDAALAHGELVIPQAPIVMPTGPVIRVDRPERELGGKMWAPRTAWILLLKEQRTLKQLVANLAQQTGIRLSEYELNRPFHVSIANLTGDPHMSIGDVLADECKVKNAMCRELIAAFAVTTGMAAHEIVVGGDTVFAAFPRESVDPHRDWRVCEEGGGEMAFLHDADGQWQPIPLMQLMTLVHVLRK